MCTSYLEAKVIKYITAHIYTDLYILSHLINGRKRFLTVGRILMMSVRQNLVAIW